MSRVCGWWGGLALLTLALSFILPGGLLRDDRLPPWAGVTLLGAELFLLAGAVVLASGILSLLSRLSARTRSPKLRPLLRGSRYALSGLLVFAYLGSWLSFAIAGRFLGRDALEFGATNGSALLRYVAEIHPWLFAVIPAAVVPLALWAADGLPFKRRLPGVPALAAVVLCGTAALAGEAACRASRQTSRDPDTGIVHPLDELYRFRRDHGAGPALHALCQVVERPGFPRAAGALPVERRLQEVYRPGPGRNRNVVVILVDSLRADELHVMPATEALGREGRVYTDCVTQASHTDYAAPCALSSQYPLRSPTVHRYPANPSYPRVMLYDVLKPLGYRTAICSSQNEAWGRMVHYVRTPNLDHWTHAGNAPEGPAGGLNPDGNRDDAATVTDALAWIEEGQGEPFFLYLNFQNAHFPHPTPSGYVRRHGPGRIDFPFGYGAYPRGKAAVVRDYYRGSLTYVDDQIARVVDALRGSGRLDRTVIVVGSDHGEAFYEHGAAAHGGPLFDEVLRVPLVVRAPGVVPGIDPRPAQLIDIAPTVLGALGLPPHPAFQGEDLLRPGFDCRRLRFAVAHTPLVRQYAVIRGDLKLVFDERLGRSLLYDRAERGDLSAERSAEASELERILGTWYGAQVEYYADRARHALEYPPRIR